MLGHVGDGKAVEITRRERRSLWRGQVRQGSVRRLGVQPFVPRVVDRFDRRFRRGEAALLALAATPVVDQLVARYAHEPGDTHLGQAALTARFDGREERLAGEILGQRGAPAPRQQIAVDPRQGHSIDDQHGVARRWRLLASHPNPLSPVSSYDGGHFRTWRRGTSSTFAGRRSRRWGAGEEPGGQLSPARATERSWGSAVCARGTGESLAIYPA